MAAVVPISCSQRWRSRSRNASTDSDFLGLTPSSPVLGEPVHGLLDEEAYDGDDEDQGIERGETPTNLIIPRAYAAHEPAWPNERPRGPKATERRRPTGFHS